ncbi:transglutaminase domain-containing protein [Hoeflea sp. YIM 152468]|uniref:transglutaminase domain-containing protein n=1 Tax=Hoeflea sp. YIM 152468 TaxID=3031759 RepID=UPI0023DA2FC7|nr:transglutaminase domain-containing protein [Hoeflea sp. YIM 152468]MDF1610039.1 transglutaminase domain-containing protein [Hoeflea sp. YIM 152468]
MRSTMIIGALLFAVPAFAADLSFVSKKQQEAAKSWIEREGFPAHELMSRPAADRAKAALFATYRYCDAGPERYTDLDDLYSGCSTQCGGFSYFYRGLAAALGIETRFFRIYNIPNQGNHVAVEAKIDGEWVFLDPTFGAYFEDQKQPLSFAEISIGTPENELMSRVRQADKTAPMTKAADLQTAFNATYDHKYMPITNYQVAEAATTDGRNELLALRIQIASGETLGDFSASDRTTLSDAWLTYTNATLNDPDLLNDTSYNAAQLTNAGPQKLTILNMSGLPPRESTSIELRFFNPGDVQEIQISSPGKELQLGVSILPVPRGASTVVIPFRTRSDRGEIFLRNAAQTGLIELFALRL